jgi:hypothetical protein
MLPLLLALAVAPPTLSVDAVVELAPQGAGRLQAIASRSVERGDRQYPWLLRVTEEGMLEAGVNTTGTHIQLCRATARVPVGERTRVGFRYDGATIELLQAGDRVASCPARGRVPEARGRVVQGAVVNVPNPGPDGPRHQELAGRVRSLTIERSRP